MINVGDTEYIVQYIHQLPMDTTRRFFNKDEALQFHEHVLKDPLCFGSTVVESTVIGRYMKKTYETMAEHI